MRRSQKRIMRGSVGREHRKESTDHGNYSVCFASLDLYSLIGYTAPFFSYTHLNLAFTVCLFVWLFFLAVNEDFFC